MEITFRWYGEDDPVSLEYIRQIPAVRGIVSALYDVPVGQEWPRARIAALRKIIESAGLKFSCIESIPVHEDIKLGRETRDRLIDAYCASVENMGAEGIPVLCYNFMPVFDWTRSDLAMKHDDGSTSLAYDHDALRAIDLREGTFELPGWATKYSAEELKELLDAYTAIDDEALWKNLEYFLKRVVPVAEKAGVVMAIHPDDPPWPIFGLPRIITGEASLDRLLGLADSRSNGLTFCTGSFGPSAGMDLVRCIRKYAAMERLHFVHLRNIKRTGTFSFHETAHPTECGDVDMYGAVRALADTGFGGIVRPDHGRMIWGETGRPGYGLYDRALGAMYILGLYEAAVKDGERK